MLQSQNASDQNKLATNWVSKMYQSGNFTQEVNDAESGIDGARVMAGKLIDGLDKSVSETNDLNNQSMPDMAVLFMTLSEWLKWFFILKALCGCIESCGESF